MYGYSMETIAGVTGGSWVFRGPADARICFPAIDSRRIDTPEKTAFFALKGAKHDGHQFIQAAYAAGVRHFVVADLSAVPTAAYINVVQVADPLSALQKLAAHHRSRFGIPVVGITGSNGKTVVKEWLWQALSPDKHVARSPGSYNSQVGVPLSVFTLEEGHELGIFEAGISRSGEMDRLADIIRPGFGIFTNIGTAHAEGFAGTDAKVAEKMQLFETADTLLYCADFESVHAAACRWEKEKVGRRRIAWSKNGLAGCLAVRLLDPEASTESRMEVGGEIFAIPFADEASRENAVHVWLAARALGVGAGALYDRMQTLAPVAMRLELKAGINGCRLINDAYSNDLAALRIALRFTRQQEPDSRLTVILSDILHHGTHTEQLYGEVAGLLQAAGISRLIGVGTDVRLLVDRLPGSIEQAYFADSAALLGALPQVTFENEVILLKGARSFALENVANSLELKAHQTVLEVNLNALVHNLHVYTRILQPGVGIMAMVKAAGYGSGPVEIARLLAYHQVDYLGVAYADEGVELRRAGIRCPMMVLNPDPTAFDALLRYDLEPEIYAPGQLNELAAFVRPHRPMRVHIKLDTGMHRLGFQPDDLPVLVGILRNAPLLHVTSVFSHLVASDTPEHDEFTHRQAQRFVHMAQALEQALGYRPLRHLMNTGGIARFPQYQFDMVRLGIGLYGVDGNPEVQQALRAVHTLKATISQIRRIGAGETVGYSRKGVVARDSRIATVTIGYADGLLRMAGNGRYQLAVHGRPAPVVGNVCMDMTMIDVTDIPGAREGDEVVVFGKTPTIHQLAACLQTIPYEVLTNISQRVKRVFFQES